MNDIWARFLKEFKFIFCKTKKTLRQKLEDFALLFEHDSIEYLQNLLEKDAKDFKNEANDLGMTSRYWRVVIKIALKNKGVLNDR